MNRKVFLSILAMDAYQRGYAPGIDLGSSSDAIGTEIGNARIIVRSSSDSTNAGVQAGFYAVAYQWGADKVISYRGTDFDVTNSFQRGDGVTTKLDKAINSEFLKDLINGWSTFLAGGQTLPAQFNHARAFFTAVSGGGDFEVNGGGPVYNDIIVTGHSLGGALAGFIDARVDIKSYLVDPIPYGATAWVSAIADAWKKTLADFDGVSWEDLQALINPLYVGPLEEFVEKFRQNLAARAPDLTGIEGVYLEDEIASRILQLQPEIGTLLAVIAGGLAVPVATVPIVGPLAGGVLAFLSGIGVWQAITGVMNNAVESLIQNYLV